FLKRDLMIQEKGEIYFFYRPKVEKEEAHSYDDVQRMYIVLRPESGEKKSIEVKQEGSPDTSQGGRGAEEVNIEKEQLMRFIVMGQKTDPTSKKKGMPYLGFVEMVTTNIQDIKDALKGGLIISPRAEVKQRTAASGGFKKVAQEA
ncbi:hypothetical protein Tco_0964287, partial [Tanacetum coccineum]